MRNSILVTAVIAFLAGILVLTLAQSEQVKTWFGADAQIEEPLDTATDTAATATDIIATDATVTDSISDTAAAEAAAIAAAETAAGQEEAKVEAEADAAADAGQTELNDEMLEQAINSENTDYVAEEEAASAAINETASESTFSVDVGASLQDRSIGDANAPIVVEEFSSLTCPHCAFFHKSIFPQIKEKYIDTGKVRWIIRGFPLNEPALRAEMVARCAPNDQYLKLINFMYENQPKWAFVENPMGTLNIMLRVAGVTNDVFEACATNTELETAMVNKLEKAATDHQINSTPTFILDGHKTISGAGTFVGFSYDLDAILRGKGLYEEPKAEYSDDDAVPPASNAQSTFMNQ